MYCFKYDKESCNNIKLTRLIEHYKSCPNLANSISDLVRKFHSSKGVICLDKVHTDHLFEVFWFDLGGEG